MSAITQSKRELTLAGAAYQKKNYMEDSFKDLTLQILTSLPPECHYNCIASEVFGREYFTKEQLSVAAVPAKEIKQKIIKRRVLLDKCEPSFRFNINILSFLGYVVAVVMAGIMTGLIIFSGGSVAMLLIPLYILCGSLFIDLMSYIRFKIADIKHEKYREDLLSLPPSAVFYETTKTVNYQDPNPGEYDDGHRTKIVDKLKVCSKGHLVFNKQYGESTDQDWARSCI